MSISDTLISIQDDIVSGVFTKAEIAAKHNVSIDFVLDAQFMIEDAEYFPTREEDEARLEYQYRLREMCGC
jgi:hypothetical protein